MFDSTGKLTYKPNNLLTYSNTFSNAAWAKNNTSVGGTTPGPNGLTGTLIVPSAASASHSIGQSVTTSSNAIIWAIAKGDGTYSAITLANAPNNYVHFNLLNGAVSTMGTGWASGGTTSLGSGWYLCWAVQQTATNFANAYFYPLDAFISNGNTAPTFTGNGTNGVYIAATGVSAVTYETTPRTADQVITTSAAYYGPRIDYDPNTLAVKGLLIEEARTNLVIQSGDLTAAAWTKFQTTLSTDGTLFLNGSSAQKVTPASGAGKTPQVYSTSAVTVTASTTYTSSWFVKAGGTNYVAITMSYAVGNYAAAVFDLSSQSNTAASQTSSLTATLNGTKQTYLGGGWFRVSIISTSSPTSVFLWISPALAATGQSFDTTGNLSGTFAGTETFYAAAPQLELGSFATSYIPTAASSVTRAADVVQFTGPALTALQGSAGSALVQMADVYANTAAGTVVVLGGNDSTAYPLGLSNAAARTYNGSTALNAANSMTLTSPFRVGIAWGASSRSLVGNGGTVATDAGGNWSGQTAYYLGSYGGASLFPNGHYTSFAIYNQRLPDATLQAKSVVGASYAANDNVNPFAPKFAANDNLPVHWRIAL